MTTWNGAVLASADDGRVTTTDSSGSYVDTGGLYGISTGTLLFRIPNVDVPQGHQIDSAVLSPTWVLGAGSGSGFVSVFMVKVTDVPTPMYPGLLDEPLTSATVHEIPASGVVGLDITEMVQEVVNLPGWTAGNALVVAVQSTTGRSVSARQIDGGPTYAATMVIEHQEAAFPGASVAQIEVTSEGNNPKAWVAGVEVFTDAPEPVAGPAKAWLGDQYGEVTPYAWLGDQWAPLQPMVWTGDQWTPTS
jgi:hypothetical protein